jgi:hypothetical protein
MNISFFHSEYDSICTIEVEQLSENIFRMEENHPPIEHPLNLIYGTEFEAVLKDDGLYDITRVTKESPYFVRVFNLSSKYTISEYHLLGDEIIRNGGFWYVYFSYMAIIYLPKDTTFNIDEVFEVFGINYTSKIT